MKIRDDAYLYLPWCVPVTVRPGLFEPHRKELEPFNVVTDLGATAPYGARKEPVPAGDLLYADLQTSPDFHIGGRLGAGRAGYYHGRYVKGVGRTPLCANWNMAADQMHATGHLSVSSAVREQIVTWYLTAKGLRDRINPCEGLLFAPLSPVLRDYMPTRGGGYACDRAMQALSVKSSNYARFSNFVWLMHNPDHLFSHEGMVRFFLLFARYLDPNAALAFEDLTPTSIAKMFSDTIDRTIGYFRDFWRAGVLWIMTNNNAAMDGRFHDLDSPTFVGGPFLGMVGKVGEVGERVTIPKSVSSRVLGLTVLGFISHVRTFYKLLTGRLESLLDFDFAWRASEREFLQEMLVALRETFSPDHILFSMDRLAAELFAWVQEDAPVDGTEAERVKQMILFACQRRVTAAVTSNLEFDLRHLDVEWARPGQRSGERTVVALACSPVHEQYIEEARFMNGLLASFETITDRDQLFVALDETQKRIEERIAPLAGVKPAPGITRAG